MIGLYFSGTGNSEYCLRKFLQVYNPEAEIYSIEDARAISQIAKHEEIVWSYPVQYSSIPKILREYIIDNKEMWQGKKVYVIATMGLFSGDGAGVLACLLRKYGATVVGGLHLKMPDSIADEKVLKRSFAGNKMLISRAENKIHRAVEKIQKGRSTREGLGFFYYLAGLFGQRLYFGNKTKYYSDKLKIDIEKCVECGKCISLCPMKNIEKKDGFVKAGNQCTMCYRCVNHCPKQAITLLGKQVIEQHQIEKYIIK